MNKLAMKKFGVLFAAMVGLLLGVSVAGCNGSVQ